VVAADTRPMTLLAAGQVRTFVAVNASWEGTRTPYGFLVLNDRN
jgi:hypothetical protein